MNKWVINSSPIIVLARLSLLKVLEEVIPEFIIPRGVVEEIQAGQTPNPAIDWIRQKASQHIVNVPGIVPVIAGWDLGKGESEVLSWAYKQEAFGVVLDDYMARKCAVALGVTTIGTIGLLIRAKRQGVVDYINPILEALPRIGFRIESE